MIAAEPAFPSTVTFVGPCRDDIGGKDIAANHTEQYVYLGLSVRDYFAAKMMHALISAADTEHIQTGRSDGRGYAETSYRLADAMLAARKKTPWK